MIRQNTRNITQRKSGSKSGKPKVRRVRRKTSGTAKSEGEARAIAAIQRGYKPAFHGNWIGMLKLPKPERVKIAVERANYYVPVGSKVATWSSVVESARILNVTPREVAIGLKKRYGTSIKYAEK
jgi:hypothetical protein